MEITGRYGMCPLVRGHEEDAIVLSCVKFGLVTWGVLQVLSRDLVAVLVGRYLVINIYCVCRVVVGPL